MRCLSCKYDLSYLTPSPEGVHRCPECGRVFNPKDPQTYDSVIRVSMPFVENLMIGMAATFGGLFVLISFIFLLESTPWDGVVAFQASFFGTLVGMPIIVIAAWISTWKQRRRYRD